MKFYKGKTVLITGHTGFKGSWLCTMLQMAGAKVVGYSLAPPEGDNLFTLSHAAEGMESVEGDIRDLEHLKAVFEEYRPEIVIHMAAQPLVRKSYECPVYTYESNVMGTVNLMECVRITPGIRSVLNVTTDKVYENHEWNWGYRESDALDGYDPYSNSKSCSELVTHSYKKSFLDEKGIPVSTARAGNVIGGGDFSTDRIIPDCVRHALAGEKIIIRNPDSIRPFQHVLEPLSAYLMIAEQQALLPEKQGYYNVGPEEADCISAGKLATLFCDAWKEGISWENKSDGGPHEASFLKLDCSLIQNRIGWQPQWDIKTAVEKTVEWTKVYEKNGDVRACMENQIKDFTENFVVKQTGFSERNKGWKVV
jgi:CDP-glucose 4,6-dehydratase